MTQSKNDYNKTGQIRYIKPLSRQVIIAKANEILESFYPSRILPIDIERILDDMDIPVIPIPELKKIIGKDAFITSTFEQIYIDEYKFTNEPLSRILVAHELGHKVLHPQIYETFEIKNVNDFLEFQNNQPLLVAYNRIETQAEIFASALLIPPDTLTKLIKELLESKNGIENLDLFDYQKFFRNLIIKYNVTRFIIIPAVSEVSNEGKALMKQMMNFSSQLY